MRRDGGDPILRAATLRAVIASRLLASSSAAALTGSGDATRLTRVGELSRPERSGEFKRRTVWWFIVSMFRRSELRVGLDNLLATAAALAASFARSCRGGLLSAFDARPVGLLAPNEGLPSRCCALLRARTGLPSRLAAVVALATPLLLFFLRADDGVSGIPAFSASTCSTNSTRHQRHPEQILAKSMSMILRVNSVSFHRSHEVRR